MSPLPNSTSAEVWKNFVLSRFGPSDDGFRPATSLSVSSRTAQLDHELEILQHPDIIILAKKRRNGILRSCSMPPEVLARVFWYTQEGWLPERSFPEGGMTLGWMVLTHVCSQWREVALSSSSLWCHVPCYAVPVRAVPTLIERSRQRKLNLVFGGYQKGDPALESTMSALREIWMSQPIRQYASELIIRDAIPRWSTRQWASLLSSPMPALEELKISLHSRGATTVIALPDDMLGSAPPPPNLHTIILVNCSLPWTSSIFSAKISVLNLGVKHSLEGADIQPSNPQFHDVLSRLTNLEKLTLVNIFPVSDDKSLKTRLPASLALLELTASLPSMSNRCLNALLSLTPSRQTRCSVQICEDAESAVISEAVAHLYQLPINPPSELHISSEKIVTLFNRNWISGQPEYGLKWIDGNLRFPKERRFMVFPDEEDDTPNMQVHSHLHIVRINTITRLAVTSDATRHFPTAAVWRAKFAAADVVCCLAVPYTPPLYHLLCALAEIATVKDDEDGEEVEEFTLFPELAIIVLYRDVDNAGDPLAASDIESAQLRLGLLNFLLARQRAEAPHMVLRVEEGVLGEEERQRIAEIVRLHIFKT